MSSLQSAPVVLGSSFSGLVVSLQLSRAGIDHVLVGGPEPAAVPRLGESMIETTGPELWRLLPEARRFCFKKNHISLFDGDLVSMTHIGNPRERIGYVARRVIRKGRVRLPFFRTLLMHVDRRGLDPILYRAVRTAPQCRFVNGLATDIETADDKVVRIRIDDGQVLENPRGVFDATGFRGVVAKAFGLDPIPLSAPQRVAWGHRVREHVPAFDRHWWQHGTNLVRLRPEIDGIRAIAWLIPLGGRISCGVSVDADDPAAEGLDTQALVDRLMDACERRGLDLRTIYPQQAETEEVRHAYTRRARPYGGNWLLVGGTYQQIWFPSSTGVWTNTAAAGLAPRFLESPRAVGHGYHKSMDGLRDMHAHVAHLVYDGFDDERSVAWFWSRWLAYIPRRLADYFAIVNDDLESRRYVHRAIRRSSHVLLKRPSLGQAAFASAIRVARPADLADQATAFPDYFDSVKFRLRNVASGLKRAVTPAGWPMPWIVGHDAPPTPARR